MSLPNSHLPVIFNEHPSTARYAHKEADWIYSVLTNFFPTPPTRTQCGQIDIADLPADTLLFVLGQETILRNPQDSVRVIFICLSAFYRARGLLSQSLDGIRLLRRRRNKVLTNILPYTNAIIDFYPRHAEVLRRKLNNKVLVHSFLLNSLSTGKSAIKFDKRRWDICIVGGRSKRREAVWKKLMALGLSLTPASSECLEESIINSRLVLNIHSEKYDNVEVPRIIAAIQNGVGVLSEPCYGLEDIVPMDLLNISGYKNIANSAVMLLGRPHALHEKSELAKRWFESEYQSLSRQTLINVLNSILERI
jgi:hypothetical protein